MKKSKREQVFNKCNGYCGYCGCDLPYKKMQVDHIIPQLHFEIYNDNHKLVWWPKFLQHLTQHDKDHIDNLMPSCRQCNNLKGAYHLEGFRDQLEQQLTRAKKRSVNYRTALRYGQVRETPSKIVFFFENGQ